MSIADWTLSIRRGREVLRTTALPPGVYTIGSDPGNRIVLPGDEIAWRHAILGVMPGDLFVEDLATDTGTFLDGRRITGRASWSAQSEVRIGEYSLLLQPAGQPEPAPEAEARDIPPAQPPAPDTEPARPEPAAAPVPGRQADQRRRIKRQVHEELLRRLDLKRLTASRIGEKDLQQRARTIIDKIIHEVRDRLPPGLSPETLAKEIHDEALGLGPIEALLADPAVTEIMVNGADQVYVERGGKLFRSPSAFLDNDSVLAVIERIVAPIGRRVDESQPYVDARLPDGSRVNVIIHPLSLIGPCLTIRKFAPIPFTIEDLVSFDTLTQRMARFLELCVKIRRNMVVSGGTGSGKTTLLNVISGYLPADERIITIEDAAELRLPQEHVVRLESRPPNIEGRGSITIRDLVRNALRMRPDRIVVGECRGGEALDMLQAMNTGHEGSLTTVHANSPRDVIARLETMVLMSGMELPLRAVREQIGAAIDLIVHTSRHSDGSRKIDCISEVVGLEGDQITMQDLFTYTQTGVGGEGEVQGRFMPTGSVPTFMDDVSARGHSIDDAMFDPQRWEQPV